MQYQIELSREGIASAIIHNNAVESGIGADRIGVFVRPSGAVAIRGIDRGTDYGDTLILDPRAFVETTDDDTYQYRNEAHEELVREGRIRDVLPMERTEQEDDAVTALAEEWLAVYRENIVYRERVDDDGDVISITWTD